MSLWNDGIANDCGHVGNGLNVVKVMPESAIKFGAYEVRKKTYFESYGMKCADVKV